MESYQMSRTLIELEEELGPREQFVACSSDLPLLREWAILRGYQPFDVHRMKMAEIVNLYHNNSYPSHSNDIHDVIVKVLEAVNAPGFEVSLTRKIARSEMQAEILSGETTKRLIKETLEQIAPRQLIVTSPQGSVTLEGLQHYRTENVIRKCALNHPIMMVGPAGCGKTTIGQQAAYALNLPFYITSTINDTHELTGFIDGYGKYHSTPFRAAFEFGGVWLADEIDAWDASALLAANAALANGYAAFPDRDQPTPRHANFRMIASGNSCPNGADRVYIGRNELDAASLDRFAFVTVDYDLNLERAFCNGNVKWLEHVWQLRKLVADKNIRHVVSTRAIIMGSAALAAGDNWNDVCESYLFKGMSETDKEKVK